MNKTQILKLAVIPGLIAATAILLSLHVPVSLEKIAGFATIVGVLAIGAAEYRVGWKQLFGRS
jgi:hypothetical protein